MTAAERLLAKAAVGSRLTSAEWTGIQAGLRDRALFSACVENARITHEMRSMLAKMADGKLSASEFRRDMRTVLDRSGYAGTLQDGARGTIRDVYTKARLDLIAKTNVDQARGYVRHLEATGEGALKAFPAYELVRVSERRVPRDWAARWTAKGGRLFGGRMIALKTDPIWERISRFGNPFPPFDYNSGMGLRNVGWRECLEIGVVKRGDPPQKPPKINMNGSLQAEVPFNGNTPEYRQLQDVFGDQIMHTGGKVVWRGNIIRDAFLRREHFEMRLGKPSIWLKERMPAGLKAQLKDKSFTLRDNWLDRIRSGGEDHRSHFWPLENDPRNIPLTAGDLELIPSLWRQPDNVTQGAFPTSLVCEIETVDGGILRMVVDVKRIPVIRTLYKRKSSTGTGGHTRVQNPIAGINHDQQSATEGIIP